MNIELFAQPGSKKELEIDLLKRVVAEYLSKDTTTTDGKFLKKFTTYDKTRDYLTKYINACLMYSNHSVVCVPLISDIVWGEKSRKYKIYFDLKRRNSKQYTIISDTPLSPTIKKEVDLILTSSATDYLHNKLYTSVEGNVLYVFDRQ